jgi:hypothetical protein
MLLLRDTGVPPPATCPPRPQPPLPPSRSARADTSRHPTPAPAFAPLSPTGFPRESWWLEAAPPHPGACHSLSSPRGTHLEELGRRSHPGQLRGSPRAGCRLLFTCCASAAPCPGPPLRLRATTGSPSHRAQAGRESGHEAKPQTPVSCLPAPPAPLPLSPPHTPEVELRAPGKPREGRASWVSSERAAARLRAPQREGPWSLPATIPEVALEEESASVVGGKKASQGSGCGFLDRWVRYVWTRRFSSPHLKDLASPMIPCACRMRKPPCAVARRRPWL